LGLWARDRDLLTQSRQAFEHVAALDPQNPIAQRELGHVLVDGRWMTPEDSFRARGLVPYEGRWVTPDEREALIGEQAAQAQARPAEREAEARTREAEARARTAEAEARWAEAESYGNQGGGIPLDMAYGYGGYGYGYGYGSAPYGVSPYGFYPPSFATGFVLTQ